MILRKIMRDIDQLNIQHLFLKEGESETRGHRFKVRSETYKRVQRGNSFSECLERAARGSSGGGYNFVC